MKTTTPAHGTRRVAKKNGNEPSSLYGAFDYLGEAIKGIPPWPKTCILLFVSYCSIVGIGIWKNWSLAHLAVFTVVYVFTVLNANTYFRGKTRSRTDP